RASPDMKRGDGAVEVGSDAAVTLALLERFVSVIRRRLNQALVLGKGGRILTQSILRSRPTERNLEAIAMLERILNEGDERHFIELEPRLVGVRVFDGLPGLNQLAQGARGDGQEQLVLVLEGQIERPLAHARLVGDLIHGSAADASLEKHSLRCIHDMQLALQLL